MKLNLDTNIFRAYDIRGVYPDQVNKESAYLIGRAFVRFINKKKPNIVISRDNRISSPVLSKYLIKGIREEGGNVFYIGLSITPILYWATAHYGFDGGIQVSASHNPAQYNGFKIVKDKAVPINQETGLEDIKNIALKINKKDTNKKDLGKISKNLLVLDEYIKFNLKDFNLSDIKPLKIVIDTANAVPGIIAPFFFRKINCKIYHLFKKLDGSFPNHLPSPHEEKNVKNLKEEVVAKKADLGIAFDGDGDRVIFIDEKGEVIFGDLITSLLIKSILQKNPGEKILCDIRSSNIVRETVLRYKGKLFLGRIGHSFIKKKMREENIIFQGELNGHYYKREHYFSEAPFWVILEVLKTISESNKNISEIIRPFKKYFHSGEINFRVENKEEIMKIVEKKLGKKGKVSKIDGLRVDFDNWWFNIRPSNTEPLLRLVVEGKTKELMEEKKKELIAIMNKKH